MKQRNLKTRTERTSWISYWIIPPMMCLAFFMTLPDMFEGFQIFQKTEKIQSESGLDIICREQNRGSKLGYLHYKGEQIQLRSEQLCSTLERYAHYRIKEITVLKYPFNYPPTVVEIGFIKPSLIEGLQPVTFYDVVDQNKIREKARVHILGIWLVTVFGGMFIFKTMRAQK